MELGRIEVDGHSAQLVEGGEEEGGGEEERKGERTGRDKFAVLVFKNV